MRTRRLYVIAAACVLLAREASADPARYLIETFDGTLDRASWRSGPTDAIVAEGGNDDAFLSTGPIVSEAPSLATLKGATAPFAGPYRSMGIADLGIDIRILSSGDADSDRPLTLELRRDDCTLVKVGKRLAPADRRWASYTFKVPAYMTSIPNGWTVRGACGDLSQDVAWNFVMQFVMEARFVLGDPDVTYPASAWEVGFDNPRIKQGGKGDTGPTSAEELVIADEAPSRFTTP